MKYRPDSPLKALIQEYLSEPIRVQRPNGRSELVVTLGLNADAAAVAVYLKFLDALELHEPVLEDLNPSLIRSYQNFLKTFLIEPPLIRETLEGMKAFCLWAYKEGYLERDLAPLITIPDVDRIRARNNVLPFGWKRSAGR